MTIIALSINPQTANVENMVSS